MAELIILYLAAGSGDEVTIDGVTYKVPRIDSGGRVYVNAKATGASEVKGLVAETASDSRTRATILTPTSGKKVRIIAGHVHQTTLTNVRLEVYFGTGAYMITNVDKAILYAVLDTDAGQTFGMTWPDGAGPVGDADEVVSLRTSSDVAADGHVVLHYREE